MRPEGGPGVVVRRYREADRDAVRDICCRTAFRGLGSSAVIGDPDLFADYWTAYYTDFEPEALGVAELDGRVVAYVMGCADTRRHIRIMASLIAPRVIGRLAWRASCGRYRKQPQARAFVGWLARRSWREAPSVDVLRFPAHYHANVSRAGQGRGLYSTLALGFIDAMANREVGGVHGQVMDYRENGVWQQFVASFQHEHPEVAVQCWEKECTLGRDVLGITRPMMNRAWGMSTDVFRLFLERLALRHRL